MKYGHCATHGDYYYTNTCADCAREKELEQKAALLSAILPVVQAAIRLETYIVGNVTGNEASEALAAIRAGVRALTPEVREQIARLSEGASHAE